MSLSSRSIPLCLTLTLITTTGAMAAEGPDEEGSISPHSLLSTSNELRKDKRDEARTGGWPVTAAVALGAGWNSNIYSGWSGEEVDSPLLIAAGELGIEHSFNNRQDRWRAKAGAETTQVFEDGDASSVQGDLDSDWRHRFSQAVALTVDVGVTYADSTGQSALGTVLTRDEDYLAYDGRVSVEFDLTRADSIEIGAAARRKDYAETPGLNTIDWTKYGGLLRYRHRGEGWTLRLWYDLDLQQYDDELASDSTGAEVAGNPTEEHLLQSAQLWYSVMTGKQTELDAKVKFSSKTDQYEDYESWSEWRVGLGITSALNSRFTIGGDGWYAMRDYDTITASTGDELSYDKAGIEVWGRWQFNAHWAASFSAQGVERDTNNDVGTTYRDYRVIEVVTGVSAAF